jgi:hypothetical protein
MSTWIELGAMRKRGERPKLLVVASNFNAVREYAEAGAMVIVHESGQKFPVELLRGLDVALYLHGCDKNAAVIRLMREREQMPKTALVYCICEDELSGAFWSSCNACHDAAVAWDVMCDRLEVEQALGKQVHGK